MFKRNRRWSESWTMIEDTNLVFNRNKAKVMVISSWQMAQYHQLDSSNKVNIKCNNKNIARVKECKLLDIILDELFELHSHGNTILKDGYFTLRTLKALKRYTSYYLRKQRCRVISIIKVRLLQHFIQDITAISNKIEWRNFYNPVQFPLKTNTDAKMAL